MTICQECAKCCKDIEVRLSAHEAYRIELSTGMAFTEFTQGDGLYGKALYLKQKKGGECFFLEGEGMYSCRVYEERPRTCREFPGEFQTCP